MFQKARTQRELLTLFNPRNLSITSNRVGNLKHSVHTTIYTFLAVSCVGVLTFTFGIHFIMRILSYGDGLD